MAVEPSYSTPSNRVIVATPDYTGRETMSGAAPIVTGTMAASIAASFGITGALTTGAAATAPLVGSSAMVFTATATFTQAALAQVTSYPSTVSLSAPLP